MKTKKTLAKPILNRVTIVAYDYNFVPIPMELVPDREKQHFASVLLRTKREYGTEPDEY